MMPLLGLEKVAPSRLLSPFAPSVCASLNQESKVYRFILIIPIEILSNAVELFLCHSNWYEHRRHLWISSQIKFINNPPILLIFPSPHDSPQPCLLFQAPSSSLTWSLHSCARALPVPWVTGGQQFDKPIKGPHVSPWRPRMASVTRSHRPPVCQTLWLTTPSPHTLTFTPTSTMSTPSPTIPPKNTHTHIKNHSVWPATH